MAIKIAEIVKEARARLGITQVQVAERAGLSQSTVSEVESGKKFPEKHTLDALAKVLGISIGEIAPPPVPFHVQLHVSPDMAPAAARSDYIAVRIVEPKLAAGTPENIATEDVVDVAWIHKRMLKKRSADDLICTFVKGDSMEPVLRDGSIVCIDTKARPEKKNVPAGSIWAVRKDEGAVVKYLQIRDHVMVLVSENKSYPVEIVNDPEAIIGRVIWSWQEM